MAKSFATAPVLCVLGLAVVMCMAGSVNASNEPSCAAANATNPTQQHALTVVQAVQKNTTGQCCQTKCAGDFCSNLSVTGNATSGARAMICGPCHKCVACPDAYNALNQILASCVKTVSSVVRVAGFLDEALDGLNWAFVIDRIH